MKCSVERYSEKCKVIHQQINDILMCSNHLRSVSTVYTFMYHWNHQLFKFFFWYIHDSFHHLIVLLCANLFSYTNCGSKIACDAWFMNLLTKWCTIYVRWRWCGIVRSMATVKKLFFVLRQFFNMIVEDIIEEKYKIPK